MKRKKQPTVAVNLYDAAICTSTAKTFKKIFSSRIGTFIWSHVGCSARELHITRLKRKNNIKKKLNPFSKNIVLASEYCYTLHFPVQIYYKGTVSWPGLTFS